MEYETVMQTASVLNKSDFYNFIFSQTLDNQIHLKYQSNKKQFKGLTQFNLRYIEYKSITSSPTLLIRLSFCHLCILK